MSHTTLEEVFLKLAHRGASAAAAIGAAAARPAVTSAATAAAAATTGGGAAAIEMVPIAGAAAAAAAGTRRVAPNDDTAAVTTASDVDGVADLRAVNLRDLDENAPRSSAPRVGRQFRAMFRKTFANQVRVLRRAGYCVRRGWWC